MAYMSQERKAKLAPAIKKVLTKYGLKGSLSVDHHSSLVLTIKAGTIDFYDETVVSPYDFNGTTKTPREKWYSSINPYHFKDHWKGKALAFLNEVMPLMNVGNHDRSDAMTDYFDVGWYVDVNIGKWDKPYQFVGVK